MQPQTGTRSRQERAPEASIRLQDLELALVSAKMRRNNQRRTCLLAAMSNRPARDVDCHHHNPRPEEKELAIAAGFMNTRCCLMDRGYIATLIERVRWQRGLPEIRKTWGTGIRALLAEPKYVLNGGRAA